MRVYVESLGCQMNALDAELVLGELAKRGHAPATRPEEAEAAILNTCSVRQHAEDKAVSILGQWAERKRLRRLKVLGVMGCMAQNEKGRLFERIPEIDFVVGPARLGRIPSLLAEAEAGRRRLLETAGDVDRFPVPNHAHRARRLQAYVEVAFGCDYVCTFCIVPFTRGREASRSIPDIVDEVKRLVDDGAVEVTLLGQTVNAYGRTRADGATFARLLEAVHEVPGLARLRFITSHPASVTDDMITAMRDLPKLCEYLHLPLQSGSDRILAAMKRLYSVDDYRRIVARVRDAVPDVAIASDFIVGFPGETEADFRATDAMIPEIGFSQSYVFKYSPRPRTRASRMDDDVPRAEKERRNRVLLETQRQVSLARNHALIGRAVEVLVEGPNPRDPSQWIGRSRQNQVTVLSGRDIRPGDIVEATIDAATPLTLFGTVPRAAATAPR